MPKQKQKQYRKQKHKKYKKNVIDFQPTVDLSNQNIQQQKPLQADGKNKSQHYKRRIKSYDQNQSKRKRRKLPQTKNNNQYSHFQKCLLLIIMLVFVCLLNFGLLQPTTGPQQIEKQQQDYNSYQQQEYQKQLTNNDKNIQKQQQTDRNQKIEQNKLQPVPNASPNLSPVSGGASPRQKLGIPHRSATKKLKINVITNLITQQQPINHCVIVNSIGGFSTITSQTVHNLIQSGKLSSAVIMAAEQQHGIQQQISQFNANGTAIYKIQTFSEIQVDSDYQFIRKHVQNCINVAYIGSSFVITQQNAVKLTKYLSKSPRLGISYSKTYTALKTPTIPSQQMELNDPLTTNLQLILPEIQNYLIIFDPGLLKILTPLNFAYYTKYTMQQMFVIPLFAINYGQNSHTIQITLHGVRKLSLLHDTQFVMANANANVNVTANENKEKSKICFVSTADFMQDKGYVWFSNYIDSIQSQQHHPNTQISVVIYMPYVFNAPVLYKYTQKLLHMKSSMTLRVKIRVMANNSFSAHAAYQSAYNYCPANSLLVLSRWNVALMPQFSTRIMQQKTENYHYYYANYLHEGNLVNFPQLPTYTPYGIRQNPSIFRTNFRHLQIFKTQFMKVVPFWILKSAELQFYETEAVIFIYMMQCIRFRFQYINQTLYSVIERNQSARETKQIENLRKYVEYSPLRNNRLEIYRFNCLQNQAYRRNAPERISRKVHQIWIGNSNISKIRMKLHESIRVNNPSYELILWKDKNITKENFPLTYALVGRTLEYQKYSKRSYNALAADLIRYQILYQHGGIYIDFKMEVLKSLDPFLKYEIFFIDAGVDETRFASPVAVGVGIIGATQNNYYFKHVLNQLITSQKINYDNQYIPGMTGGVVVRKAFNDEQLFTVVGLGYHLFIPKPSALDVSDCLKVKSFTPDQQVFEIVDSMTKRIYKTGIPCKQYPQAYIVSYKPLASSWKGEKRNMN